MRKKNLKIYQEEAKLRQITHWDMDCMTTAELDAMFDVKHSQETKGVTQSNYATQKATATRKIPAITPMSRFLGRMIKVLRRVANNLIHLKVRKVQGECKSS